MSEHCCVPGVQPPPLPLPELDPLLAPASELDPLLEADRAIEALLEPAPELETDSLEADPLLDPDPLPELDAASIPPSCPASFLLAEPLPDPEPLPDERPDPEPFGLPVPSKKSRLDRPPHPSQPMTPKSTTKLVFDWAVIRCQA